MNSKTIAEYTSVVKAPDLEFAKSDAHKKVLLHNFFVFADSETTTKKNFDIEGKVRTVIVGGITWGVEHKGYIENMTMIDFLRNIEVNYNRYRFNLKRLCHKRSIEVKPYVYFHNLKFDGSFIRCETDQLNNLNLSYKEYREQIGFLMTLNHGKVRLGDSIEAISKKRIKEDYTTLKGRTYFSQEPKDVFDYVKLMAWQCVDCVGDMGILYKQIVVTDTMLTIEIRDSLKLFDATIEQLGEMVGIPKLDGDWDYAKKFTFNYKPDEKERGYFIHDIQILSKVMTNFLMKQTTLKLTRSSYAFEKLKSYIDYDYDSDDGYKDKEIKERISDDNLTENIIFMRHATSDPSKRGSNILMPTTNITERQLIQTAYSGGLVGVNKPESVKYLDIGEGRVYDANSMYPAAMLNDMPCGEGISGSGKYEYDKNHPFFVQFFRAEFELKESDDRVYIPMLKPTLSRNGEVVRSDKDLSEQHKILSLCSIDLKSFFDNYDVSYIEYIGYYKYSSVKEPFAGFVNDNSKAKVEATIERDKADKAGDTEAFVKWSTIRDNAKRTLNSAYGKWAQRAIRSEITTYIDETGTAHNRMDGFEYNETGCLIVAIYITAYARQNLLKAIKAAGNRIVYWDTDSIHVKGDFEVEGLDIHQSRLGAWKVESTFRKARYLRKKTYVEDTWSYKNNKYELLIKYAGLDKKAKKLNIKTTEDLAYSDSDRGPYVGVTVSRKVPGGTLISDNGIKQLRQHPIENDPDENAVKRLKAKSYFSYLDEQLKLVFRHSKVMPPLDLPTNAILTKERTSVSYAIYVIQSYQAALKGSRGNKNIMSDYWNGFKIDYQKLENDSQKARYMLTKALKMIY